jgi:hypothetical protein
MAYLKIPIGRAIKNYVQYGCLRSYAIILNKSNYVFLIETICKVYKFRLEPNADQEVI